MGPALNYYLTPVIILALGTYLLTCVFFSVYSMAGDTLFLCFLEDLEMNDGPPEKPYYMSKGLMGVLGKKNKEEKEKKGKDKDKVEDLKESKGDKSAGGKSDKKSAAKSGKKK